MSPCVFVGVFVWVCCLRVCVRLFVYAYACECVYMSVYMSLCQRIRLCAPVSPSLNHNVVRLVRKQHQAEMQTRRQTDTRRRADVISACGTGY